MVSFDSEALERKGTERDWIKRPFVIAFRNELRYCMLQ